MPFLRRLIRLPLLIVHVLLGIAVIGLALGADRLAGRDPWQGLARRAQAFWCRSICRLLGVRLRVVGQPMLPPPALLVANHVSWLDILVFAANWHMCFLSKSEVRRWPGIGWLATGLGTIYIERGKRGASTQAIRAMQQRLRKGGRVLFFPEGTTGPGTEVLPFRSRLFQAAIEDGIPVQPLTIRYAGPDGSVSDVAAFVGNDRLLRHTVELAGNADIDACITVGDPVHSSDCSRKELARSTREQMVQVLERSRSASMS